MARAGDVIEHPVTGERILFLKTAEDTGGEALEMEFRVRPGGFVAASHIHPEQEERFEIQEGTIRFTVDGRETDAVAGESVTVPAGVPHVWRNPADTPARLTIRFRPALQSEAMFESFFGLAQDGKTDPVTARSGLLQTAVLINAFRREVRLPAPPAPIQRLMFGTLAAVGRLVGYRDRYPYPYVRATAGEPEGTIRTRSR